MSLAIVRNLSAPRALRSALDADDFEQQIVDEYALAMAAVGLADPTISNACRVVAEFVRFSARRVWEINAEDADRYLVHLRRERKLAPVTVEGYCAAIARFYDFAVLRYQGDVHALTGCVLAQPIDEFNRPAHAGVMKVRVPPAHSEVDALFGEWAAWLPRARKYLTAARDYLAASLWRRAGLRIQESAMLDVRDWRPDLGQFGKLHVRFGKGSRGRGPKPRLVPALDGVDRLLEWWFTDVRHQFGDDWNQPDAPLLPSERRDELTGFCNRVGTESLRTGFAGAVHRWLPSWDSRLTPHALRHYCASALYERGVDLRAIQSLLGHDWITTTSYYIHVDEVFLERQWIEANRRVADRLSV